VSIRFGSTLRQVGKRISFYVDKLRAGARAIDPPTRSTADTSSGPVPSRTPGGIGTIRVDGVDPDPLPTVRHAAQTNSGAVAHFSEQDHTGETIRYDATAGAQRFRSACSCGWKAPRSYKTAEAATAAFNHHLNCDARGRRQ
jgi:hypothetical protein